MIELQAQLHAATAQSARTQASLEHVLRKLDVAEKNEGRLTDQVLNLHQEITQQNVFIRAQFAQQQQAIDALQRRSSPQVVDGAYGSYHAMATPAAETSHFRFFSQKTLVSPTIALQPTLHPAAPGVN